MKHKTLLIGLLLGIGTSTSTIAQTITIPQAAPYTSDANTLLLEHFDGTTSGSPNGSVTYSNGMFGQGVRLVNGSWVSWNMGALANATVEFWGKLDSWNSDGTGANFVQSCYSQFNAQTFGAGVGANSRPGTSYHIGFILPNNWITSGTNAPPINPFEWHHFATTWGSQGFHFYVDGVLVHSSGDTYGQNPSTGWWAVGGLVGGGTASGPGFNGMIDELRISNVQREFTSLPALNISVSQVRLCWPALSNVTYQVQYRSDLTTNIWTDLGSPIVGTGTNLCITDEVRGGQKFYRLEIVE